MAMHHATLFVLALTSIALMTSFHSSTTSAMSLNRYKSCLYECLHCVNTWGKELFNGELCAHRCHMTKGDSIDSTCKSYFTRSSRRASTHQRQIAQSYDAYPRRLYFHQGSTDDDNMGLVPSYVVVQPRTQDQTLPYRCHQECRRCESQLDASMDPHACLFTCLRSGAIVC